MYSKKLPRRKTISISVLALLLFLFITSVRGAQAQSGETGNVCVRDFQTGAVCTANDVRIEQLTPITILEACDEGTINEAEVQFEMLVSAAGSPDRYDVGVFIALDGGSARDGDACLHDYLDPPMSAVPTYGDANLDGISDIDGGPWFDNDSDMCGDIETNTQVIKVLQTARVACVDDDGDGNVEVSVCSSWDNNAGTTCSDISGAFPGTNSKCSCDVVTFPFSPTVVSLSEVTSSQFASLPAVVAAMIAILLGLITIAVINRRRPQEI